MSKRAEELEHPLLAKLLCSPIQRAPLAFWMGQRNGHSDHPFSFERAINCDSDAINMWQLLSSKCEAMSIMNDHMIDHVTCLSLKWWLSLNRSCDLLIGGVLNAIS